MVLGTAYDVLSKHLRRLFHHNSENTRQNEIGRLSTEQVTKEIEKEMNVFSVNIETKLSIFKPLHAR